MESEKSLHVYFMVLANDILLLGGQHKGGKSREKDRFTNVLASLSMNSSASESLSFPRFFSTTCPDSPVLASATSLSRTKAFMISLGTASFKWSSKDSGLNLNFRLLDF